MNNKLNMPSEWMTKDELQAEINNITEYAENQILILKSKIKNFKKITSKNPTKKDFDDMEELYNHLEIVNQNHFPNL